MIYKTLPRRGSQENKGALPAGSPGLFQCTNPINYTRTSHSQIIARRQLRSLHFFFFFSLNPLFIHIWWVGFRSSDNWSRQISSACWLSGKITSLNSVLGSSGTTYKITRKAQTRPLLTTPYFLVLSSAEGGYFYLCL